MKKWYQSKTIWVNIVAAVLGIIPAINADLLTVMGIVDANKYLTVLGAVTTVLNLFLRMTTTKTIETK